MDKTFMFSPINKNNYVNIIKYCIYYGLEYRIEQILESNKKNNFITKKDIKSLLKYMDKEYIASYNLIEYIYLKSPHRHVINIFMNLNELFHLTCDNGNLDLLKLLLSPQMIYRFPDINKHVNYQCLEILTICDNLEMISYILSKEMRCILPNVDPACNKNELITIACECNSKRVAKFLLSDEVLKYYKNINPADGNNKAIRVACEVGNCEMVEILLSDEIVEKFPSIDPGAEYNEAIVRSCMSGKYDILKILLSERTIHMFDSIDPCQDNNKPIRSACSGGHLDIVKLLLSDRITSTFPNIKPSAYNNEAIGLACKNNKIEVVKFLLSDEIADRFAKYPVDPSDFNNYCLYISSLNGNKGIVEILLQDERVLERGFFLIIDKTPIYNSNILKLYPPWVQKLFNKKVMKCNAMKEK